MAKDVTLQATYRLVTPLFLGGANPNDCAELREPSIKAALRFWYRAIDPDYDKNGNEARIFGGTAKGEGQAIFLLRVDGSRIGKEPWDPDRYGGFNDAAGLKNGIRYLSFSLKMGNNKRKYIKPHTSFTLQLTFKAQPTTEDGRRIAAALWLLGHLGGLGSRSRRGFGTVALQGYASNNANGWLELAELSSAHNATSAEAWVSKFKAGIKKIKEWLQPNGSSPAADHTVLNSSAQFYLFESGAGSNKRTFGPRNKQRTETYEPWETALNAAGRVFQDFRQRRTVGVSNSDYEQVKAYLDDKQKNPLPGAPARTAFGLPLTFRYNSLNGRQTTFQGEQHDRSASPLFIRIVDINGKCHPFFALLDTPLLAPEEIKEQTAGKKDPAWPQPSCMILDDFWKCLPLGKEIPW